MPTRDRPPASPGAGRRRSPRRRRPPAPPDALRPVQRHERSYASSRPAAASAAASTDSRLPNPNRSARGGRTRVPAPAVGVDDQMPEAADHRQRPARQLALGQVGGGGQLVGQRHRGDLERVAVAILAAGVRLDRTAPRPPRWRGRSGPPATPGRRCRRRPRRRVCRCGAAGRPAAGRHWRPGPRAAAAPFRRPRWSCRRRRRPGPARSGCGRSGSGPGGRPSAPSRRDHLLPVRGRYRPSLGLADDLGRDDEDVAVGQRPGRVLRHRGQQHRGQIGLRVDLADARRGEDADHAVPDLTA